MKSPNPKVKERVQCITTIMSDNTRIEVEMIFSIIGEAES